MKLSSAIQEALLALLCYDGTPGGAAFVRGMVPVECFDPYFRDIAKAGAAYLDQYKKPAGEHTLDLIEQLGANAPDKAEVYERIYQSLEHTKDKLNREYVLKQAKTFIRYQGIRAGIERLATVLEKDDEAAVVESENILRKMQDSAVDLFDVGTYLTDHTRALRFLDEDVQPFLCGVRELDRYGLGPARGRLHLYVAPAKTGKSMWLANLAKWGLIQGLKVLVVTLEMSEPEYCGRLFQAILSISKRGGKIEYTKLVSKQGGGIDFDRRRIKGRPSFKEEDKVRVFLKQKMEGLLSKRPPIVVKGFPSGTLTIEALRGYLDGLEAQGFIPDLMIVDYVDLMHITSATTLRIESGRNCVDLRGIGIERNIAIATAAQANREGTRRGTVRGTDIAEDISKTFTADTVVTGSATPMEAQLGLRRLLVTHARSDKSGFQTVISQCYALGQFCLGSFPKTPDYEGEFARFLDDQDRDEPKKDEKKGGKLRLLKDDK